MSNVFKLPVETSPQPKTNAKNVVLAHIGGNTFNPNDPDISHMNLPEFSRVMANQCRFGGHTIEFYSIAQHSVLVAALSPKDELSQKWALLHDADETFSFPDLPTPIKPMFPDFVAFQKKFSRMVANKYDLPEKEPPEVKKADILALALERVWVMHPGKHGDIILPDVEPPSGISIDPLSPKESRHLMDDAFTRVFEMDKPITLEWLSKQPGFRISDELINDNRSEFEPA